MPKFHIDYQNTVLYKIVCNDANVNDVYIGYTTNFTKKKYQHKNACNNPNYRGHQLKSYKVIRENGGWDNWSMIEIEKYPCNGTNEASKRERYLMVTMKAFLNSYIRMPKKK